jgi:hypothetical protein
MTSKIYRGYKTYRFITKSNGMSQKTSAKKILNENKENVIFGLAVLEKSGKLFYSM